MFYFELLAVRLHIVDFLEKDETEKETKDEVEKKKKEEIVTKEKEKKSKKKLSCTIGFYLSFDISNYKPFCIKIQFVPKKMIC